MQYLRVLLQKLHSIQKALNSKHKDHILNLMLHDAAYEEMEVEDNKNEKNECNYCIEII